MLHTLFNWFTKLTGWPAALVCFRTKIHYEDRAVQGRHIKGAAVIVSNHTSVFDYGVYLFVFFTRTLRTLMAEVLFKKKLLALFLKLMGGIRIDRDSNEFGFMGKCEQVLAKKGVVCIFPEGRLPKPGEARPLRFMPGAAYLSFETGVPVIPVYTNGSYFRKQRAQVVIGTPLDPVQFAEEFARGREAGSFSDKDCIAAYNQAIRDKVIALGRQFGLYEDHVDNADAAIGTGSNADDASAAIGTASNADDASAAIGTASNADAAIVAAGSNSAHDAHTTIDADTAAHPGGEH